MRTTPLISVLILSSMFVVALPAFVAAEAFPDPSNSSSLEEAAQVQVPAEGDLPASSSARMTLQSAQTQAITGTIQATVERDDDTGVWTIHAAGSYSGAHGTAVVGDTFLYGMDDTGSISDTLFLSETPDDNVLPPTFNFSQHIPAPPLSWTSLSFGIHISDDEGKTANLSSDLFPVIWNHPVVLNHAIGGTIVDDPNYAPNGVPPGIGIPHTLINGLPEADYYAVVFFEGLIGCPSNNYAIGSFKPGEIWGVDTRGPGIMFNKAWSTSAGGCMQEFHVDPHKDGAWMWGALSNTGSAPAIGDLNEVPAFVICGSKAACDTIAPSLTGDTSEDPPATTTPEKVSSVLFLPGIKGSFLYEKNPLCVVYLPVCDISVWLPLTKLAVPKLFMDAAGKSVGNVYAKEGNILRKVFGVSFYDSFAHMMDDAQDQETFGHGWEWKSIAYDWRISIVDLLAGGAVHDGNISYGEESDMPYIEQSLRELASSSPTGKVTIIAHSNGGLVAKALMRKIGDAETSQLVDSLILVGVPQTGAPRALGSLLYGEGESIPSSGLLKNVIMSAEQARTFAQNSPMAYHLLPSAAYTTIQNLSYPLVKFGLGASLQKERDAYGETIDSPNELHDYLLALHGERPTPAASDLHSAAIGNENLLSYAESLHTSLDAWQPPAGVEVYQIGGYGIDTISGIQMYEEPQHTGASTTQYLPLFTRDGDGTVPILSSLLLNTGGQVHTTWVDLGVRNAPRYSHATMLEMPEVQHDIADILGGSAAEPPIASAKLAAPDYSEDTNRAADDDQRVGIFVRGESSLVVTDEQNRKAGTVATDSNADEIPGSQSGIFGEITYAIVPSDGNYVLDMRDFRSASTSITIQDLDGDEVLTQTSAADIPVTTSTHIAFSINETISTSTRLSIDTNGDGNVEETLVLEPNTTTIAPSTAVTPESVDEQSDADTTAPHRSSEKSAHSSKKIAFNTATTSSLTTVPIVATSSPENEPRVLGASVAPSNSQPSKSLHEEYLATSSNVHSASTTLSEKPADVPAMHPADSASTKKSLWQRILDRITSFLRKIF